MRNLVTRFAKDEQGAAMVEYGLLIALIALVAAVGAQTLGTGLSTMFGNIGTTISAYVVPPAA